MKKQLLLLETEQDTALAQIEIEICANSRVFGELSESQRKFVILYLQRDANTTIKDVAAQAGISKTKAYEFIKSVGVLEVMAAAAQVISGYVDVKGSLALDHLVSDAYDKIVKGNLQLNDLTPTAAKILLTCKDRLGLNPVTVSAMRSRSISADGTVTESESVSSKVKAGASEQALSELQRRRRKNVGGVIEAEIGE